MSWPEAVDISVVVPTRGRPDLLPQTLDSIAAQDFPGSVECIVVHDEAEIENPVVPGWDAGRILVREMTNERSPGLAGARNTGILAARGELVAFCDDDDTWDPRKLRLQVDALERLDALVVSCANVVHYGGRRNIRRAPSATVTFHDLLRSRVAVLHSSTIMARREAIVESIGLIDEEIPRGASEDYEWQLRASRVAPIAVVDEPLVDVAWHERSLYAGHWSVYVGGLEYILDRYPEFSACRRGKARVQGQIAFGYAAMRNSRAARRWAASCIRHDWRQPRAYLAMLVSMRLVSPDALTAQLNRRGKGI
jgi:glycosyltransferase involved in cell wall biosynthesis